ncbi:MAG: hypothetical protein PHT33_04395 [bacterium]|nr:hypothetical protein [bacterium]
MKLGLHIGAKGARVVNSDSVDREISATIDRMLKTCADYNTEIERLDNKRKRPRMKLFSK